MSRHGDDERPPLGFLVVRIAEALDRLFVIALADLRLKPRHLRLLVLVDRTPGLSQGELARQLGVDAGNLIALLDTLEGEGLLRRERHPSDRRQRLLNLTADGQRRLERALHATRRVEDRVFADMPANTRAAYYDTTLAVYTGLSQPTR